MVPLSWRNMNPGNLRGEYFGATGSSGGFATYPDWTSGWNAMESQLDRYYAGKTTGKPLRSVREIINTWAPSSENDTDSYVKKVAKDLGVDPDVILPWTPEVKKQLMTSMASHEAGRPTTYGATGENTMPPGILDPEALSIDVPDIGGLLASLGGGGPNVTPPMNQAQEHLWAQLAQIPGVGGQQTQPSSPGFGQRALTNPWLQMGLGILTADPSRGPLAAIAGGVQKGLLGVNAAEQQQIENQQREQQREQARMWQSLQAAQTMQDILKQAEKFRSDGRIKPQDLASVAAANYNVMRAKELEQKLANPSAGWKPSLGLFDEKGEQVTELRPHPSGVGYVDGRTGEPVAVPSGYRVAGLQSAGNLKPTKVTDAQRKSQSYLALAKADTDLLMGLATREENPVDLSGAKGIWLEWQSKPELLNQVVQWGVGKVAPGLKATPDEIKALSALARLQVNILAAVRGAQVGPKEEIMFRRSLAIPGSPDYVDRLKMQQRNLQLAENIAADKRGDRIPFPDVGTDTTAALVEFLRTPEGALAMEAERSGIKDPDAMDAYIRARVEETGGAGILGAASASPIAASGGGASLSDTDKAREAELKAKYPWLK